MSSPQDLWNTHWYMAILTNGVAYASAALCGALYSKYRYEQHKANRDPEEEFDDHHMKWYDYIIYFFIILIVMYGVYFFMYWVFGYLPMTKTTAGIAERIKTNGHASRYEI